MIDTLARLLPQAEARWPLLRDRFGRGDYVLVTLHRPSNVDDPDRLAEIWRALQEIAAEVSVIFPVHPRTRAALESRQPGQICILWRQQHAGRGDSEKVSGG